MKKIFTKGLKKYVSTKLLMTDLELKLPSTGFEIMENFETSQLILYIIYYILDTHYTERSLLLDRKERSNVVN